MKRRVERHASSHDAALALKGSLRTIAPRRLRGLQCPGGKRSSPGAPREDDINGIAERSLNRGTSTVDLVSHCYADFHLCSMPW
jgi:hypothetical protein